MCLGGVAVVAGEQHRLRARLAHGGYYVGHVGAQGVREGDEACRRAGDGYVDDRAAPRAVFLARRRAAPAPGKRPRRPAAPGCPPAPGGPPRLRRRPGRGAWRSPPPRAPARPRPRASSETTALPRGCSLRASTPAGQAVELRLVQRGVKAVDGGDLGPARRSACRSCRSRRGGTLASRSSASPSRTRKPCFVALPMAAMMAVGVASTRAQGQNTTSMVTARIISPVTSPGQRRREQSRDHDPGGPAVRKADDLGLARVRGLDKTYHALDGAVLTDFVTRACRRSRTDSPCRLKPRRRGPCPRAGDSPVMTAWFTEV